MFTPHPAGAFCAVVSMICGAALSPAQAEVLGGRLSLAHSAFVDDTSMAKSAAVGSIELPMGERFSMQSDLGLAGLHALDAQVGTIKMRDLAREVLAISAAGLKARARTGAGGLVPDETHFLNALNESVETGKVPADEMLEKYHGQWAGDLSRIYAEYSY